MSTHSSKANQRRVAFATVIGTTVEWYDFFIYATAAGLVFAQLFFEPAGASIGLLLSFASVGISFLFRPLGAFLAGHYGDKIGRRAMLVLTLILMGAATTLIGFLPTYATAGVIAPIMLLLLRILQGISAGGEWGGAVLMAVEHAPSDRRGRAGAFPQLGVPLGLLLASGVTALMTGVISPGAAFLEWGWRVPFLLSIVLIAVGYFVRRAVDESPVFQEIAAAKKQPRIPIVELFRRHGLLVIIAALIFAGNNAAGYMATGGFIPSYASSPAVGHGRTDVLIAVAYGAAVWLVFTYLAGYLSDRIGRKKTYFIGFGAQLLACFPLFWMINTGSLPMLYLALTIFTVRSGTGVRPAGCPVLGNVPCLGAFLRRLHLLRPGCDPRRRLCPDHRHSPGAGHRRNRRRFPVSGRDDPYLPPGRLVGAGPLRHDLSIRNQAEQEVGALVFDRRTADVSDEPLRTN